MQTGIIARLISLLKVSLIMMLVVGMNDVFAEYYVVYSAPAVACMSCATYRHKRVYKPKRKYYTYKKPRRHYARRACPRFYQDDLIRVYQWRNVPISPCGGAWVTSAASCYSDELPPSAYTNYYREQSCSGCTAPENYWIPYNPDRATADDRAYFYPDMNWGY